MSIWTTQIGVSFRPKGEGNRLGRDWEVSVLGVHDMKFPNQSSSIKKFDFLKNTALYLEILEDCHNYSPMSLMLFGDH